MAGPWRPALTLSCSWGRSKVQDAWLSRGHLGPDMAFPGPRVWATSDRAHCVTGRTSVKGCLLTGLSPVLQARREGVALSLYPHEAWRLGCCLQGGQGPGSPSVSSHRRGLSLEAAAGPESSARSSQPPACEEAASVSDGRSEPASSQRAAGAWPCADTRHPTLSAPTYGSRFESYPFLTTEEMEGLELHGWLRAAVWLHGAESDPEPVLSALSLAPSRAGEDKIGKGLWDLQNAVCDSC